MRWRASSAFPPGCGATPTCSISSVGSATTTTTLPPASEGRFLRPRSLQPARFDRGGLAYLEKVDSGRCAAGPRPVFMLRSFRRGRAGLRLRTGFGHGRIVRGRGRRAARRVARRAAELRPRDGRIAEDDIFYAEQNARLVKNAEHYYRAMFRGDVSSWNLRDRHMVETLDALAHISNTAMARPRSSSGSTTRMSATPGPRKWADQGELNVGQLVRESYGNEAFSVGSPTFSRNGHRGHRLGRSGGTKSIRRRSTGSIRGYYFTPAKWNALCF